MRWSNRLNQDEMLELYQQGMTMQEVANTLSCSKSYVQFIISKFDAGRTREEILKTRYKSKARLQNALRTHRCGKRIVLHKLFCKNCNEHKEHYAIGLRRFCCVCDTKKTKGISTC